MKTIRTSRRIRVAAALGAPVVAALVWALPGTAYAAPEPPQLSIAVDDGRASADASDRLTYAVTVTNLGTTSVKDLIISQTIPDGAELTSTDPEASEKGRTVSWSVDVKPGKTTTLGSSITVDTTLPDGLLRFATVACARVSAKASPVVCASDSDQLPAGAAADEQRETLGQPAAAEQGWWPLPGAPVLGGLGLAAAIATLLLLRRRSNGQHLEAPRRDADSPADLVSGSRR